MSPKKVKGTIYDLSLLYPLRALPLTVQCDAVRPSCGACCTRRLNCHYETEDGVTRMASLKRKHDAMQTVLEQMLQRYMRPSVLLQSPM